MSNTNTDILLAECPFCHNIPVIEQHVYRSGQATERPKPDPESGRYQNNIDHYDTIHSAKGTKKFVLYKYSFRLSCKTEGCIGNHVLISGTSIQKVAERWNEKYHA